MIHIRVIRSISGLLLEAVAPGGESHLAAVRGQVRHHVRVRLAPLLADNKKMFIKEFKLKQLHWFIYIAI